MAMNLKVTLLHKNATQDMKRMAERVIDGNLLHATTPGGRRQDAISIYNRMMGIKSTAHDYETIDTSEPAYVPPPPPVSEAGLYEKRQQAKQLGGMATILAEAVATGVAKALAVQSQQAEMTGQRQTPESSPAPTLVESAVAGSTGTMKTRPRL